MGGREGWLSVVRQCAQMGLSRSSLHYEPKGESEANLALMRRNPFNLRNSLSISLRRLSSSRCLSLYFFKPAGKVKLP